MWTLVLKVVVLLAESLIQSAIELNDKYKKTDQMRKNTSH